MKSFILLFPLLLLLFANTGTAADDPVVFKSSVALTRIDAQVVDHDGRAITGLQRDDFTLQLDGRLVPIRNFASENMPIDILLLLDVSGSMQPHVQRIASAAQQALDVLADKDRVAIMVFDTSTRVRLPFRSRHDEVTGELNRLLRYERFNGGTRITHALLEAASYVQREARPEARRAIVILTDDQTQDQEEEARVGSALNRADAVLSFLQAPYEAPGMNGGGRPRGTWGNGGGWPGGGGIGGGPVIFGRGRQERYGRAERSHTAGTADIAHDSGGDTIQVDEASALEDTFARLRQRYSLYFYTPEGSREVGPQNIRVGLAHDVTLRFEAAEVRFRRVYMSGGGSADGKGPVIASSVPRSAESTAEPTISDDVSIPKRRRVAVNEDSTPRVNTIDTDSDNTGQPASASPGSPGKSSPQASTPSQTPTQPTPPPTKGGWPRVSQQNTPPQ